MTTFIKVLVAFVFEFHILWLKDFSKIFRLKGLKFKTKGQMNFYECCEFDKKLYPTSPCTQHKISAAYYYLGNHIHIPIPLFYNKNLWNLLTLRKIISGLFPGILLNVVLSYFFSKSSKMNCFTSGSLFKRHPAQDSILHEWMLGSSPSAWK